MLIKYFLLLTIALVTSCTNSSEKILEVCTLSYSRDIDKECVISNIDVRSKLIDDNLARFKDVKVNINTPPGILHGFIDLGVVHKMTINFKDAYHESDFAFYLCNDDLIYCYRKLSYSSKFTTEGTVVVDSLVEKLYMFRGKFLEHEELYNSIKDDCTGNVHDGDMPEDYTYILSAFPIFLEQIKKHID
jgi:hypothetical protein